MPAYSFQKRFVGHVLAGLEPGPWLPGMKRHTLRAPRDGRQGHARPEQPVHLFTAMRTKHCRKLGIATARVQLPVRILVGPGVFTLERRPGAAPRSRVRDLAPIVQQLLDQAPEMPLDAERMEEFARTDGFASAAEMASFFEAPAAADGGTWHLNLVLVGWTPKEKSDG